MSWVEGSSGQRFPGAIVAPEGGYRQWGSDFVDRLLSEAEKKGGGPFSRCYVIDSQSSGQSERTAGE